MKKVKPPKYTINQFHKEFPNDSVCLDRIFELRCSKVSCCPACSQQTTFKRVEGRRAYQCSDKDCQYQIYPTAGTVFEKTRTSLKDWFYAMYLMTSTRNGVSAKELERQLGVTYKTAWRMGHCIRELMQSTGDPLKGAVEVDETYFGGKTSNKHKWQRDIDNAKGTGYANKIPLIGILERDGNIRVKVIEGFKALPSLVNPFIQENVAKDSRLITDGLGTYRLLAKEYKHEVVSHKEGEYVRGDVHTNTIEGFFSHLKRTVKGTHIQVSRKYLERYANECAFRYAHRDHGQKIFHLMLDRVV